MDCRSIARAEGVTMGHIRQRKLREGGVRYQAEVRLKGHPTLTATFDVICHQGICASSACTNWGSGSFQGCFTNRVFISRHSIPFQFCKQFLSESKF